MNGRQRGQVLPLVVGLTLVVVGVTGLAVDGTRAFLFRRTLQNAADSAALAAASDIDEATFYSSGGERLAIDRTGARRTAAEWLAARGLPVAARVEVAADEVTVTLRGEVRTTFLRVVGIGTVPVAARGAAAPLPGEAPP